MPYGKIMATSTLIVVPVLIFAAGLKTPCPGADDGGGQMGWPWRAHRSFRRSIPTKGFWRRSPGPITSKV